MLIVSMRLYVYNSYLELNQTNSHLKQSEIYQKVQLIRNMVRKVIKIPSLVASEYLSVSIQSVRVSIQKANWIPNHGYSVR